MRTYALQYRILIFLLVGILFLTGCGLLDIGGATPTPIIDTQEPPTEDPPTAEPTQTNTAEPVATEAIVTQEMPENYVYAWYGRIVALPAGSQYEDYLVIYPEGTGEIGIEGEITQHEEQIINLRDKPPPGNHAHFWGTLICPAVDYGGCQLRVESMRIDEPGRIFEPNPVVSWVGTIATGRTEPGSGGDDYFQLDGEFAIQYGIDATSDPSGSLAQQIESLRDTGTSVRVWGWLIAGVPDWNATQLQVNRLEIIP